MSLSTLKRQSGGESNIRSQTVALTHSSKVKRCKAPVLCYANSGKSFNIFLSGDIEKNPGPGSHPVKFDTCEKTIRTNSKTKKIVPFVATLLIWNVLLQIKFHLTKPKIGCVQLVFNALYPLAK